jgi:hypothetical protein
MLPSHRTAFGPRSVSYHGLVVVLRVLHPIHDLPRSGRCPEERVVKEGHDHPVSVIYETGVALVAPEWIRQPPDPLVDFSTLGAVDRRVLVAPPCGHRTLIRRAKRAPSGPSSQIRVRPGPTRTGRRSPEPRFVHGGGEDREEVPARPCLGRTAHMSLESGCRGSPSRGPSTGGASPDGPPSTSALA